MEFPVIKLQLETMREEIAAAMALREDEFAAMIAKALEKELTPENLHHRVEAQVTKAVDEAVNSLSQNYVIKSLVTDIVAACLRDHERWMARVDLAGSESDAEVEDIPIATAGVQTGV